MQSFICKNTIFNESIFPFNPSSVSAYTAPFPLSMPHTATSNLVFDMDDFVNTEEDIIQDSHAESYAA